MQFDFSHPLDPDMRMAPDAEILLRDDMPLNRSDGTRVGTVTAVRVADSGQTLVFTVEVEDTSDVAAVVAAINTDGLSVTLPPA